MIVRELAISNTTLNRYLKILLLIEKSDLVARIDFFWHI